MASRVGHHATLTTAFLSAAHCYWLNVFPRVQRELHYWCRRAREIPDPELRRLALETHRTKWCNVEGAAAFATLAPPAYRRVAIKVLVSFQALYDYADTLAEQPQEDPIANGRLLHQSLLVALNASVTHPDYYAYSRSSEDGGYLMALSDTCRGAFDELPAHTLVIPAVRRGRANRHLPEPEPQRYKHAPGARTLGRERDTASNRSAVVGDKRRLRFVADRPGLAIGGGGPRS